MRYGLIHDGSGESRVGGGDVRSFGGFPCPRPDSLEILARVRGCCGVRSAPRVVPVAGTQNPEGMAVLEGLWDKAFGDVTVRPPLWGESSALRAHGLVEGARSGQPKD